jgi:DNA-binding Lrp family transcriptional regulator
MGFRVWRSQPVRCYSRYVRAVFVMLKVEPGSLRKVAEAIADLEIVSEMYSVVGDYDLLAKIYVDSFDDLAEIVNDRIQGVPHIRETKTVITFDAYDVPKPKGPG